MTHDEAIKTIRDDRSTKINKAIDELSELTGEDFHGYRSEIYRVLSSLTALESLADDWKPYITQAEAAEWHTRLVAEEEENKRLRAKLAEEPSDEQCLTSGKQCPNDCSMDETSEDVREFAKELLDPVNIPSHHDEFKSAIMGREE